MTSTNLNNDTTTNDPNQHQIQPTGSKVLTRDFTASPSSPTLNAVDEEQDSTKLDRIRGWQDIQAAFKLTWQKNKKHLFTTWVHVPLGVTLILVICWGLRLAIEQAPFRFPAPVIAMIAFFALLLLLELLSIKFPGSQNTEKSLEAGQSFNDVKPKKRKRFVDPFMLLLAPPCEFCLRNMSVMFTPSFILIPAREVIPSKEIGLLAAWFIISQVLAFVIPVFMNRGIQYSYDLVQGKKKKVQKKEPPSPSSPDSDNQLRRGSSATPFRDSRRGSMATLAGVDYEKGMSFSGGQKLGAIATGLSGVTAHVIAPITHVDMFLDDDDVRRHMESTAMEQARQQGVQEVICTPRSEHALGRHHQLRYDTYSPKSDVSNFQHHVHRPRSRSQKRSNSRGSGVRSRSVSPSRNESSRRGKEGEKTGEDEENAVSLEAALKKMRGRPWTSPGDEKASEKSRFTPSPGQADFDKDDGKSDDIALPSRPQPIAHLSSYKFPITKPDTTEIKEDNQESSQSSSMSKKEGAGLDPLDPLALTTSASQQNENDGGLQTFASSRRESENGEKGTERKIGFKLLPRPLRPGGKNDRNGTSQMEEEEEEEDAIERLASWFGDLITPTIYFIVFIVGIPLFFLKDFALPLFLGINLLTFIAAITIVPPPIRRFLHPILSTSLATVLIIWAFAAMKGIGLMSCLNRFYSVDAKYNVIWDPNGYSGPVPGAGDILFSTLDAGIVALAVPMYRYRKELWQNLTRMLMVLFPCAALSLFFWNYIARLMGMDPSRSLAFTARFMSTPLAIELAGNVGADESITVILVVITGVIAAILKEQFFYKLMRVSKEDYLTVGLTMGATSGAIGASSLISTPRTMAIASLSFVVFGAILLVCTAIPPIVDIVQSLAGANL